MKQEKANTLVSITGKIKAETKKQMQKEEK